MEGSIGECDDPSNSRIMQHANISALNSFMGAQEKEAGEQVHEKGERGSPNSAETSYDKVQS